MFVHNRAIHNLLPPSLLALYHLPSFISVPRPLSSPPRRSPSNAHKPSRHNTGTAYVQGIGVILRNVRVESLVIIRFFNRATMQIRAYTCMHEGGEKAICITDRSRYRQATVSTRAIDRRTRAFFSTLTSERES